MPIELKMPALSPTMEEGTLAKWLVKEGDEVKSGDILAEIETDKATMEFEAVDEGKIAKILVPEGTDGREGRRADRDHGGRGRGRVDSVRCAQARYRAAGSAQGARRRPRPTQRPKAPPAPAPVETPAAPAQPAAPPRAEGERVKASPLARTLAQAQNIDLSSLQGSGPGGRIVRADVDAAAGKAPLQLRQPASRRLAALGTHLRHAGRRSSRRSRTRRSSCRNIRKTIARRLTESKQQIPHIYLTVDIQLDALLKLRGELNEGLESRGIKLSVNDLLIKALAQALIEVPECNVSFAGDQLFKYSRADISVAVSIPAGLITPIIVGAEAKSVSAISTEMKELAAPRQGGQAPAAANIRAAPRPLSNMGMYGIKQFEAVINPPQGMIMAIGAGEKRPYVIND